MPKFKHIKYLVLLFSVISIFGCAHQDEIVLREKASQKIEEYGLPIGVQKLLYSEQVLLSRAVNIDAIMSPAINHQEEFYKPENRNVFELNTYWVKENDLYAFTTDSLDSKLKSLMTRKVNGKMEYRLIVHPESEDFYADLIAKSKPAGVFYATSTSSSRTLVVWPPEKPELAFFGKLSLNKEIGGVVRTIPKGEVARSIGVTKILDEGINELPETFHYLPETIGIMPKELERGGMIIRQIPKNVREGTVDYIPQFSLYGNCANCGKKALIIDMINKSGMPTEQFVKEKILSPFIGQWLQLALKGIIMEPHAQNVLIGIGNDGLPNGEYLHRDFGGFNIDFELRRKLRLKIPEDLPIITTRFADYHQKSIGRMIESSLHTYYVNGFVYNLDTFLSEWAEEGLIPSYPKKRSKSYFQNMFYEELARQMGLGRDAGLNDPETFNRALGDFRKKSARAMRQGSDSCFDFMQFFFPVR